MLVAGEYLGTAPGVGPRRPEEFCAEGVLLARVSTMPDDAAERTVEQPSDAAGTAAQEELAAPAAHASQASFFSLRFISKQCCILRK